MNQHDLKTGDLLFFDNEGCGCMSLCSCLIKKCTRSNITHIAMVVKDPDFLDPPPKGSGPLQGLYVWESNWEGTPDPQDGKIKLGVQITPLQEICESYMNSNSPMYVRRINCDPSYFSTPILREIHKVVHNKMYDIIPLDWIKAIVREDANPQKTDRFWCSALVGYIYTECSILPSYTDWSILRPSDFAKDYLELVGGVTLDKMKPFIYTKI